MNALDSVAAINITIASMNAAAPAFQAKLLLEVLSPNFSKDIPQSISPDANPGARAAG